MKKILLISLLLVILLSAFSVQGVTIEQICKDGSNDMAVIRVTSADDGIVKLRGTVWYTFNFDLHPGMAIKREIIPGTYTVYLNGVVIGRVTINPQTLCDSNQLP